MRFGLLALEFFVKVTTPCAGRVGSLRTDGATSAEVADLQFYWSGRPSRAVRSDYGEHALIATVQCVPEPDEASDRFSEARRCEPNSQVRYA